MAQTTAMIFYLAMFLMACTIVTGQEPPSPMAPGPTVNEVMNCAAGLSVCASAFEHRESPSTECCTAIDTALKTQLPCFCGLIRSPLFLVPFNATAFNALLSQHCGFESDPNLCSTTPAQAPLPHETVPPPPGAPKAEKNVASKLVGTSFVKIVLIMIAVKFY